MKKTLSFVLAACLLLSGMGALGDDGAVEAWLNVYNELASLHGIKPIPAGEFEYDADEGCWDAMPDDDTLLVLYLKDSGEPYLCALHSKAENESLLTVATCALAACDEKLGFEGALVILSSFLSRLNEEGNEYATSSNGWYFTGVNSSDGDKNSIVLGFVRLDFDSADASGEDGNKDGSEDGNDSGNEGGDDDLPDGIWDGLEPDGGDEQPGPEQKPLPTEKPREGHYKA